MSENKSELWWITNKFSCLDKNKKSLTNSVNKKHNKCFQWTVTVALYHEETKKHWQRITEIKPLNVTGKE